MLGTSGLFFYCSNITPLLIQEYNIINEMMSVQCEKDISYHHGEACYFILFEIGRLCLFEHYYFYGSSVTVNFSFKISFFISLNEMKFFISFSLKFSLDAWSI